MYQPKERIGDDRKLFVGGLPKEISKEQIEDYFKGFGAVTDVNVKVDIATGRPRGFCFVTFEKKKPIKMVCDANDHILGGKKIDCKPANGRDFSLKVFVGGVTPDTTEEQLRDHFCTHGTVTDIGLPINTNDSSRKGFAFVTFEDEDVVDDVIKKEKQEVNGKICDVRRAIPQDKARGRMSNGRSGPSTRGRPFDPYASYGPYDAYGGYDNYSGGYGNNYGSPYNGNNYGGPYGYSGPYSGPYNNTYNGGYGGGYSGGYGGRSRGWKEQTRFQ